MTKKAGLACCLVVCLLGIGVAANSALGDDTHKAEIDALKKALEKYQDPYTAVRDLYLSTVGCVYYSGEKIPDHMDYAKGAMGIHFVNVTVTGPEPDPMRPNVLIYEPHGNKLTLVGVEWLVPLKSGMKRPELFGQPFQGPMEGHYPLIPTAFHHYDLHVWLFRENPNGLFSSTNPNVSCENYDFALLEQPTKMVPEQ